MTALLFTVNKSYPAYSAFCSITNAQSLRLTVAYNIFFDFLTLFGFFCFV